MSPHSGLPISVVDHDKLSAPLAIKRTGDGEGYVFNPGGQVIDVSGLLCLYDARGACANAIKDAQRTKTSEATVTTLNIVWSSQKLGPQTEAALQLCVQLLRGAAEIEPVDDRDLYCRAMEAECACPYCGEPISLWLDADGGSAQSYIEDCSVCCRPMQVYVYVDADGEASASVSRQDD